MSNVPVTCFGGSNGSASVIATGGTPGYTYSWTPSGGTTSTISSVSSGNYLVTVTDLAGCTTSSPVNVPQPTSISILMTTQATMCGMDNGSVTANVSGGTGAYHYSWLPTLDTISSIQNLSAGNYTVTITDANACTRTASATVAANTSPQVAPAAVQNVTCNGNSDGALSVAIRGIV